MDCWEIATELENGEESTRHLQVIVDILIFGEITEWSTERDLRQDVQSKVLDDFREIDFLAVGRVLPDQCIEIQELSINVCLEIWDVFPGVLFESETHLNKSKLTDIRRVSASPLAHCDSSRRFQREHYSASDRWPFHYTTFRV